MAPTKAVLTVGVAPSEEGMVKLQNSQKEILAAGYDYEMMIFPSDDFFPKLDEIKDRLRAKKWDGLVVGFGIRGNPKNTEKLETLVTLAAELVPGVKFGFPRTPDDVIPCFQRNFEYSGEREK